MYNLYEYLQDGASSVSRAVLAYLCEYEGIENSLTPDGRHTAKPRISRWENCPEQGYIVILRSKNNSKQLNIAFFEHRDSDSICAVMWEQMSINAPTIDTAYFRGDTYDLSFSCGYKEAFKMAEWIHTQMEEFWKDTEDDSAS